MRVLWAKMSSFLSRLLPFYPQRQVKKFTKTHRRVATESGLRLGRSGGGADRRLAERDQYADPEAEAAGVATIAGGEGGIRTLDIRKR